MLRRAAGGGAVLAGTTLLKFGVMALGLTAFWGGFWAGANYALSFLIIMLLHWTVATKQPAMTAPAMAQRLGDLKSDASVEAFVDDVVHLIRSQAAGIFGNLALCAPLVLAAQGLSWWLAGSPLVGEHSAEHVLDTLTLLGPTALFAAFTGVLLFASSLIAGWAENWFVFHRLDSAIAWNPTHRGAPGRVAGAALVELVALQHQRRGGQCLAGHDARHRAGDHGLPGPAAGSAPRHAVHRPAGRGGRRLGLGGAARRTLLVVRGRHRRDRALNIGVSFWLAFKLAARARGVRPADQQRIAAALSSRLRHRLPSFLWPGARE